MWLSKTFYPKLYRDLLFDADGVLLNFKESENQALPRAFAFFSCPFDERVKRVYEKINGDLWTALERGEVTKEEVLLTRFGKTFRALGKDYPAPEVSSETFERIYQNYLAEGAYVYPETLEVIRKLALRFDLYIVTNGVANTQERRLRETGLYDFFLQIFISERIGAPKPSPRFFAYVEKHIRDFDKEKALLIGDSLSADIQGAQNAGLDAYFLNREGQPLPEGMGIKGTGRSLWDVCRDLEIR